MYSGERKFIGLFVNNIDNEFQPSICTTVSRLAMERGYDIGIFNTFANSMSGDVYENLEIKLIDLAPIERMDAIIVLTDTYGIFSQRYYLLEQVKGRRRKDCPVINLRGGTRELNIVFGAGNYYSVSINELKTLETLVEHVITVHNRRNLCFMSGPKGHEDADARRDCFLRVCDRYGIPRRENAVFYGDFWRNKTIPALEQFYSDPSFEPDAIICANDYMAIEILMELINRGKKIPDDVIVTGFDNLPDSNCVSPTLTTIGVILYDMSYVALKIAENCWNGIEQPMECKLEPCLKRRESCGCNNIDQYDMLFDRNRLLRDTSDLFFQQMVLSYTYMGMSGCRSLSDIIEVTRGQLQTFPDMKEFYMFFCTETGSSDISETTFTDSLSDKMMVVLSVKDGKYNDYYSIPENERCFPTSQIMPDYVEDGKPSCYYYVMLHNKEQCFGYTAIRFNNNKVYAFNYASWMISCSVGLTELINRCRLEEAIKINERMSVTDALTQLLNRRGFEDCAYKMIKELDIEKENICIMSVDLDGLKQINDHYGHAEGDFAIRTVGNAISGLTGDRGVAARMGGDEFMIMRTVEKDENVDVFAVKLEKRLKVLNESAHKPYKISASVGIECAAVESYKELEAVIHRSDEKLYAAKRQLRRRAEDSGS